MSSDGGISTLYDVIGRLRGHGSRPAVVAMQAEGAEEWSFSDLAQQSRRLAAGLRRAGFEPGGRAALLAANRPEWIVACFAVVQAGGVAVPIDAQIGRDALDRILDDSGVSWLCSTAAAAKRLAGEDGDRELATVLLDAGEEEPRSWRQMLSDEPADPPQVEPDDTAVLFYTSGTSGAAKGVPLSHGNLASNVQAMADLDLVHPDDRLLLPLPLHHVYPFTVGMLLPLTIGMPIILPRSLSGPQIVRAMTEAEATCLLGVPRIYSALLAAIEDRVSQRSRIAAVLFRAALGFSTALRRRTGLSVGRQLFAKVHRRFAPRLRMVVSGGSPIDRHLARKLEGCGWVFANGYGLTETSPLVAFNEPGRARIGTVGRPLPGVEVRIAEPEPEQAHGEILVKGPNVFSGYWNLPEKTDEAFTSDGFFRTGDLGEFDEDGYLRVVGRASTLIPLPGGENVWPEDVEEALAESEAVSEAGVFLRDDKLAAVVVPEKQQRRRTDAEQFESRIEQHVAEASRRLPSHHRVAEVAVSREPLARTRLGKIRRHLLKKRYDEIQRGGQEGKPQAGPMPVEEMSPENQALLDVPVARQTWNWLAERFPDARLSPQTDLQADLGIDSMQWLRLGLEIQQQTGHELDEEAIGRMETVSDLLREITEAEQSQAGRPEDVVERLREPDKLLDDHRRRWLRPRGAVARGLGAACFGLDRLLLRGAFRLRVFGQERAAGEGPVIFTPNHASYLDAPALAAALPADRLHRTCWGGAVDVMFRNPLIRLFSRAARVIPIDPRRDFAASLALAVAALERGDSLVWFPEGARSPDGRLKPFQPGIAMVLEARPVPVVPVWIGGTHEALPPGAWRPRMRQLTVRFGEPIEPDALAGGDAPREQRARAISQALHDRVAGLEEG